MEKVRGFEIAKGFENEGINLPKRKTKPNHRSHSVSAEKILHRYVRPLFPGRYPSGDTYQADYPHPSLLFQQTFLLRGHGRYQ